jgi:DNA-binding NarL/FixJ family response regulator
MGVGTGMTAKLDSLSPPPETEKSAPGSVAVAPIRIILADSQAIYRVGIRKVFALEDDLRVVAKAETLQNLYLAIQRFPTDIVLLEGGLLTGAPDAIPTLLQAAPHARIIVQVNEVAETNMLELYRAGVRGVISRSIAPDLLVKCVRKIAQGETWIDNQSINWVIEAYRAQAVALINPRERPKFSDKEYAIISCVTQGMRNKEIASHVGTTEQVVKNYLRKVYDKLGVSDRLELALYCLHHQLLKDREGTSTASKVTSGSKLAR